MVDGKRRKKMSVEEIAIKLASWGVIVYTIGGVITLLGLVIAIIIEVKNSK